MEDRKYSHTWIELVRAGFWFGVGIFIVLPAILALLAAVFFFLFSQAY